MRNWIFLVVVVVLITGAVAFLTFTKGQPKEVTTKTGEFVTTGLKEKQEVKQAKEGKRAPDFTLEDFEGNIVQLSDFRGKPVFIDFWTRWCPFCTDEMPEIEALHQEFGDRLVVLGIHRTNTESADVGRDFARNDVKVTYTILKDTTDEVYRAYTPGFAGMPVAAWIDEDGILVKLKIGPKTSQEMRQNTGALFEE